MKNNSVQTQSEKSKYNGEDKKDEEYESEEEEEEEEESDQSSCDDNKKLKGKAETSKIDVYSNISGAWGICNKPESGKHELIKGECNHVYHQTCLKEYLQELCLPLKTTFQCPVHMWGNLFKRRTMDEALVGTETLNIYNYSGYLNSSDKSKGVLCYYWERCKTPCMQKKDHKHICDWKNEMLCYQELIKTIIASQDKCTKVQLDQLLLIYHEVHQSLVKVFNRCTHWKGYKQPLKGACLRNCYC